ncbi:MAG TPA: PTS sugar transporter subunit IIA [Firmicutes bacterium]|nr:PTS sugar transporter subunit IIA [Candidatus Fermentithermobacillaceae bacterium]
MVGIVIMSHGDCASGLLSAASLIMGDLPLCKAVGLYPGESLEDFINKVRKVIEEFPNGVEVFCLVDLFGGTPANTAALLYEMRGHKCITGVNLPMLLEILSSRETSNVDELVAIGQEAGKRGILNLADALERQAQA